MLDLKTNSQFDVAPIGNEVSNITFVSLAGHEAFQTCNLARIEGHDFQAKEAEEVLSPKTKKLAECQIYATYVDGLYYYHSNYIPQGFVYPTKVLTYERNLLTVLKMVSGFYSESDIFRPTEEELVLLHHFKVKYILDQRAISRFGLEFDYCGTNRISVTG